MAFDNFFYLDGGCTSPANHPPPYPLAQNAAPEFRREALRLLRSGGRSPKKLADELGCTEQTLRNWLRQDEADRGERSDVLSSEERSGCGSWSGRIGCSSRSGRSSSVRRLSSPGRPRGRGEVSVRRGGAGTVSCLPIVQRGRRDPAGLLRVAGRPPSCRSVEDAALLERSARSTGRPTAPTALPASTLTCARTTACGSEEADRSADAGRRVARGGWQSRQAAHHDPRAGAALGA